MGENIESTEREEEVRLQQRLIEARKSEFWNKLLRGINGWTAGDVIETIIYQLGKTGEKIALEDIDPEGIYNDFNR